MEHYIQTLLLNVLFLCFFLLFVPLLIESCSIKKIIKYKKSIFTLSACFAIISCIAVPISIDDGFIFDLRLVATIVGSLYGGVPVAIFLWAVNILFRMLTGGHGAYSTIIVSTILMVISIGLHKRFLSGSKLKKMTISGLLAIGTSFLVFLVLTQLNNLVIQPNVFITYLLLQFISAIIIVYILEFIHETTLLKKQLYKAEKMEVVSHLASSISHEVRNPLTVVKGFLQVLLQTDLPKEKQQQFLTLSVSEIDRANDIIRDYLTFAKPAPENIEIFDVKEELSRITELIRPLANMNSVSIRQQLHSGSIKGETQLFQQCLVNILKNCVEAMPDNGVLTIETYNTGSTITIKIADTGAGMTEEQITRLGEPYFTTKGRNGTGLGMMTAISIIHTMGGSIKVDSKINKGTTFYLQFPINTQ